MYQNEGLLGTRVFSSSGMDTAGTVRHITRDVRVPPAFMVAPQQQDWKWVCLSLQNKGSMVRRRRSLIAYLHEQRDTDPAAAAGSAPR